MNPSKPEPVKRTARRLLARLIAGVLILLVLFHRPLLQSILKHEIIRGAASEKIRLTFHLEGNLFNELRITHLKGIPVEPGHLNKLEADDIRIHYSFVSLLTRGIEHFLKSCDVKNVTIEITPVLAGVHPPKKQPGLILHDILHPPFFIADRYRVKNLNFISHTPNGDFILNGVHALLDPAETGFVEIAQLEIPKVHTWKNLKAQVTCNDRSFMAHDFSPDPEIHIHSLELDTHPSRPYRMAVNAEAFGGTAVATLTGNNGEDEISNAHLAITLHHGSIQEGFAYFKHPLPVEGNLSDFSLDLLGNPDQPVTWNGALSARIGETKIGKQKIENVLLSIIAKNGNAHSEIEISHGQNQLKIQSNTQLPEQSLKFKESSLAGPLELVGHEPGRFDARITQGTVLGTGTFSINAEKLTLKFDATASGIGGNALTVTKADLNFFGTKKWSEDINKKSPFEGLQTALKVQISDLRTNNYSGISGELALTTEQEHAIISQLELKLNATDGISGNGSVSLGRPFNYDGQIAGNVHDLALFNPLLQAVGFNQPIAGSLLIDWHGFGTSEMKQHSGYGTVKLLKGRLGDLQPIEADLAGNYSPESMDFPTFEIEAGQSKLNTVIRFQHGALELNKIRYQFNHQEVATGTIQVPMDLLHPEVIIPPQGKISMGLAIKEMPIESLAPERKLPIQGNVSGGFTADGNLEHLNAVLQIQGRNLQSKSFSKLAPASLDLGLSLAENRLTVSGTLKQPEITPLQISGELPFPLLQIIRDKKIDDQSPIRLAVKLPKTSVAFLARLIPDLRFAEGQANIDAGIAGTIAKPELHGSAQLDLPALRFQKPDWPAINRFKGDLLFSGNRLTLNRFGGEISGGNFNLAGQVQFVKLTEPVLDLRFTTQGALIARNETLTIRTDSNIQIHGPFNQADVTGEIGITKSRFFREIELLPLQLPGRPAPKPPETTGRFSFKDPPLRDWKFNLAIKTKDPFLVRGNLTNGVALIDLKLGGTGFAPTLDGSIRIENFTASLPFSTLEMNYGFIYFNQKNPFIPILDLQATSSLRDYNIRANIYGEASNPQTVLSSDPPLPQEDILALLATGATTQDLTGSADLIAGRAAVLVFQHFYSKIFKRQETTENESFLNRFQFDVGTVDPRTGKQEATARFKIGEKFYLIGSVNVLGDIRGQVKYLLQFR